MTGTPAIDAMLAGFGTVEAIVDLAIPLMVGVTAVVVAAQWGMKMLNGGGGSDDYDSDGNFLHDSRE